MNRISVAMTTYNGARFVAEQLQSILAQSTPPDELVICDDRSDDETVTIITRTLAGAPFRVELVENDRRLGVVANVEQAIGLTTGDIIVLADQDDVWLPQKLTRQAGHLSAEPDVGAVFSDGEIIDRNGMTTGKALWPSIGFSPRRRAHWSADPMAVLLQGNVVTGATLAFRSSLKELVLPISRHGWHDLWIAVLTAATCRFDAMSEPLISYRVHGANAAGVFGPVGVELRRRVSQPGERFDALIQMDELVQRLEAQSSVWTRDAERVRGKARHLQHRVSLPTALSGRVTRVVGATLQGRYHRYSSGLRSALVDLAVLGRL